MTAKRASTYKLSCRVVISWMMAKKWSTHNLSCRERLLVSPRQKKMDKDLTSCHAKALFSAKNHSKKRAPAFCYTDRSLLLVIDDSQEKKPLHSVIPIKVTVIRVNSQERTHTSW
jgi:hypothetical protein